MTFIPAQQGRIRKRGPGRLKKTVPYIGDKVSPEFKTVLLALWDYKPRQKKRKS